MATQRLDLGLTAPAAGCGGDACACAAPAAEASAPAAGAIELGVTGMTCSHCVRAVTEEVSAIEGVTAVDIDLVADGVSRLRVQASGPISDDALRAAVAEAGYTVADGR